MDADLHVSISMRISTVICEDETDRAGPGERARGVK
jgi:hypothetical protein